MVTRTIVLLIMGLISQASQACDLENVTMFVEKTQCSECLAVNVTICSGYCRTWDPNMKNVLKRNLQVSCQYEKFNYLESLISGCTPDEDPFFRFPSAVTCKCLACDPELVDCTEQSLGLSSCIVNP
uniref:Glycoprotein hormone beta subunit n=1 Tax=Eptatretus atami TaxID=50612 RepID=E0D4Q3_9VERT|nr:glycoprotein hormone beta subunit [Eptatretus atami]